MGGVVLLASIVSEWRAFERWSPVRALGTDPHQTFVIFARGELRLGRRSTAGFFTRALPRAGWAINPPARIILNPPERVWMAWRYTHSQSVSYILPVTPLAGVAAGIGFALLIVRPRRPGSCRECGYDLAGLRADRCPECGAGNNTP